MVWRLWRRIGRVENSAPAVRRKTIRQGLVFSKIFGTDVHLFRADCSENRNHSRQNVRDELVSRLARLRPS